MGHDSIPKRSIDRTEKIIQKFFIEKEIKLEKRIIKELTNKVAFPHPDLKDKMRLALIEFSVPYDNNDLNLVSDRNEIVHKGQFKSENNPIETTFWLKIF